MTKLLNFIFYGRTLLSVYPQYHPPRALRTHVTSFINIFQCLPKTLLKTTEKAKEYNRIFLLFWFGAERNHLSLLLGFNSEANLNTGLFTIMSCNVFATNFSLTLYHAKDEFGHTCSLCHRSEIIKSARSSGTCVRASSFNQMVTACKTTNLQKYILHIQTSTLARALRAQWATQEQKSTCACATP